MRYRACHLALLGAGLVVLAGACEKADKDRIESSKTIVLDEGAEPRIELRYAIPEGSKQSIDMIMDMSMEMSGAGMGGLGEIVMPRMIMVSDIEVTRVDPKTGGMDAEMVTTAVRVEDRPGAMGGLSGMMEAELEEMEGMRMTMTLMPDGRTRNMKLDEKSVSAKVREQMRQTEQVIDQMTALLPDVPVGKGARWRVEQTVRQQGMRVSFAYTYEVVELTESGATIIADVELTAPTQTIEQNGVKAKLDRMTGSGKFKNVLDFKKMVDRVEGSLEMDMSISAAGQWMTMSMEMGVQIVPTGTAAKPGDAAEADD